MLFGILAKLGAFGGTFLLRFFGVHLLTNHLAGLGVGTLQSIIEFLGWRGVAGAVLTLYFTRPGFKAGVDDAIRSLL